MTKFKKIEYYLLKAFFSFIGLVLVDYFSKRWFDIEFWNPSKFLLMWFTGFFFSIAIDLVIETCKENKGK